jgi:hypothetical protein
MARSSFVKQGTSAVSNVPSLQNMKFFDRKTLSSMFFMCRSRLSYEQFAAFLANIKELNAHRQSQAVTGNRHPPLSVSNWNHCFVSFGASDLEV